MLKLSWGSRIAMLYSGFVLLIITMVIMCMKQDIDLVSKDYYAKELAFQGKIDEMNNANSLSEKVKTKITETSLEILLPAEIKSQDLTGEILFYRPSDASKDFKYTLRQTGNTLQQVPLTNFSKGMYKMQLSWTSGQKSYFTEQVIVIP
jgi:hypothetical protein